MAQLLMSQDAIDSKRSDWLAARRAGVTASEIASIIGLSPHTSAFALFTAKTTGLDVDGDNDAMARGRHLEPYVADRFTADHPNLQLASGGLYFHDKRPWQLATYDRLAFDPMELYGVPSIQWATPGGVPREAVPVQIKTAIRQSEWGDEGSPDIPVHYRAQALWEMDVWDAPAILIPVLFVVEWKVSTYVIRRDEDTDLDLAYMREAAEEFLARIRENRPPDPDWTASTTRALRTLHPTLVDAEVAVPRSLAKKYFAARRAKAAAEQRLGLASNRLRERMGNAARAVVIDEDGKAVTVATRRQYGQTRLDAKYIRRHNPALAKAAEKTTPVDALFPGKYED